MCVADSKRAFSLSGIFFCDFSGCDSSEQVAQVVFKKATGGKELSVIQWAKEEARTQRIH